MIKNVIFTSFILCALTLGSINSLSACGCSASNDLKGFEKVDNSAGNTHSSGNVEAHRLNPSV